MSLTRRLEKRELGLIRPSTFRESVRRERVETLRSSLHRIVDCSWSNNDRERAAGFTDGGAHSAGYLSVDIEKTESRYLLAGCTDGSVEIFDLDPLTKSPMQRCTRIAAVKRPNKDCHQAHCNWVQWYERDNGIFLTSSNDKTVKIWDANHMTAVESFPFNMPVFMHHLGGDSANGQSHSLIAVATDESNVRLVDMRSGSQTQHLGGRHQRGIVCVQWSPYDSNVLLSGGRDGALISWDIRSGKSFLKSLINPLNSRTMHPIIALKFCPPREYTRMVSMDSEGNLSIWDAFTFDLVLQAYVRYRSTARTLKSIGIDFACSHGCNYLFVPSGTNVEMIDLSNGRKLRTLPMHMLPTFSCSYRGWDYQELYTGSTDKTIGCLRPESDETFEFPDKSQVQERKKTGNRRTTTDLTQDTWSDSD